MEAHAAGIRIPFLAGAERVQVAEASQGEDCTRTLDWGTAREGESSILAFELNSSKDICSLKQFL